MNHGSRRKPKTIKLLKETQIRQTVVINDSQNTIHTGKKEKLDFTKMKNYFFVRDTAQRMKRQTTDWEKIFVNQTSYKMVILEGTFLWLL